MQLVLSKVYKRTLEQYKNAGVRLRWHQAYSQLLVQKINDDMLDWICLMTMTDIYELWIKCVWL